MTCYDFRLKTDRTTNKLEKWLSFESHNGLAELGRLSCASRTWRSCRRRHRRRRVKLFVSRKSCVVVEVWRWLNKRVLISLRKFLPQQFLEANRERKTFPSFCILFHIFLALLWSRERKKGEAEEDYRREMFWIYEANDFAWTSSERREKSHQFWGERRKTKKVSWQLLDTQKPRAARNDENPEMTTKYHRLWKYPDAMSGESRHKKLESIKRFKELCGRILSFTDYENVFYKN